MSGVCEIIRDITPDRSVERIEAGKRFENEEVPEEFQGEHWNELGKNIGAYWWDMGSLANPSDVRELNELKADFVQHLIEKYEKLEM